MALLERCQKETNTLCCSLSYLQVIVNYILQRLHNDFHQIRQFLHWNIMTFHDQWLKFCCHLFSSGNCWFARSFLILNADSSALELFVLLSSNNIEWVVCSIYSMYFLMNYLHLFTMGKQGVNDGSVLGLLYFHTSLSSKLWTSIYIYIFIIFHPHFVLILFRLSYHLHNTGKLIKIFFYVIADIYWTRLLFLSAHSWRPFSACCGKVLSR